MFLNINKFEKEVKRQYKDKSITIGMVYDKNEETDMLMLWAGIWAVYISSKYLSNKIKALVVELLGDMPKPGQIFEVSKQDPTPQLQIFHPMYVRRLDERWEATNKLVPTNILLEDSAVLRLFQDFTSKDILQFDDNLLSMIDQYEIDIETESMPTGPCRKADDMSLAYWHNEVGTVIIAPRKSKNKDIIEALKVVSFKEKESKEATADAGKENTEYDEQQIDEVSSGPAEDDSEG